MFSLYFSSLSVKHFTEILNNFKMKTMPASNLSAGIKGTRMRVVMLESLLAGY